MQTFNKYWNSDTAPNFQPAGTYRDLMGMVLRSNSGNDYALELKKGNRVLFSLEDNYQLIGLEQYEDGLVAISAKSDGSGIVGVVTINHQTQVGTHTPMYAHKDFNFLLTKQCRSLTNPENTKISRVYWTDRHNPPRALNLKDERLTTYINSSGLTVGEDYMVVDGIVSHNSVLYGPNEPAGTVFRAVSGNYTGTGLVVEYIPIELLDWTPLNKLGKISFDKFIGGNLFGGQYQFFLQLEDSSGVKTNYSYLSLPIAATIKGFGTDRFAYANSHGETSDVDTKRGIRIKIDNIDQNFNRIRVGVIRYTALNVSEQPVIFFESTITGSEMTFDYTGSEFVENIEDVELYSYKEALKTIYDFDILKNINFPGNIELFPEVDLDASNTTAEFIEYEVPVDNSGNPDATVVGTPIAIQGLGLAPEGTDSSIKLATWYRVTGGNIEYPVASGLFYGDDVGAISEYVQSDFVAGAPGTASTPYTVSTGTPTVQAVIKVQNYTGNYTYTPIKDDWYDGKGGTVNETIKSHWRAEKYRYGILVYSARANRPWFVHWALDRTFPEQFNLTTDVDPETGLNYPVKGQLSERYDVDNGVVIGEHYTLRHLGLKFSNIEIFKQIVDELGITYAELPEYVSGFSIVRAPRDEQIYAQGIGLATHFNAPNVGGVRHPNPAAGTDGHPHTYLYYSPDFHFGFDGKPQVADDDIRIVSQYRPVRAHIPGTSNGYGTFCGQTGDTDGYLKYLEFVTPPGAPLNNINNKLVGSQCRMFEVAESGSYGEPGQTYDGNARDIGSTVMSKSFLMRTQYDETAGDFVNGVVPRAAATTPRRKPIINIIRAKTNPYGGTSDAAKANTVYQYVGHYQSMDADFIAHLTANSGIANDVEVWGGDCFPQIMAVAQFVPDNDTGTLDDRGGAILFPVEGNVNSWWRSGRNPIKDGFLSTAYTDGISYGTGSNLRPESWVYEDAYSSPENVLLFGAKPLNFTESTKFGNRILASQEKSRGENIDSFRIFTSDSILDVDSIYGDITNVRSKNSRLFFWQQNACGYVPVDERSALTDTLGSNLTIGTLGVLPRYDISQDMFGNQNTFGLIETPLSFLWYDLRSRNLLEMTPGHGVKIIDESHISTLLSGFSDWDKMMLDNPVTGTGITGIYDYKRKYVYMTFRANDSSLENYNELTVAIDVLAKEFVGRQPFTPGIYAHAKKELVMANSYIYKQISTNTSYSVGEIIGFGSDNYVCISDYTTGTLFIPPTLDTTHWARINSIEEVYIDEYGDYAKYFGLVHDAYLEFVINDEPKEDKVFDNVEFNGSEAFFNTILYKTERQEVEESLDSDEYERRYDSLYGSVPFASAGSEAESRMSGKYMIVRLTRNNRLNGNPIVSKNEFIKLVLVNKALRKTY